MRFHWRRKRSSCRFGPRRSVRLSVNLAESGAGDGNRTHVRGLGSRYSTIEPRPLGPNVTEHRRFPQGLRPRAIHREKQLRYARRVGHTAGSAVAADPLEADSVLRCAAVFGGANAIVGGRCGLQGPAGVHRAPGEGGRTQAHLRGSGPGAGDHRDDAARHARRRSGAAVRAAQGLASTPCSSISLGSREAAC